MSDKGARCPPKDGRKTEGSQPPTHEATAPALGAEGRGTDDKPMPFAEEWADGVHTGAEAESEE